MSARIDPQFRLVDGVRIRYAAGGAASGRPILFTSPWPESIVAFNQVWPLLAGVGPLVAVDLPGFGQSEWRADLMEPRAMGDFMLKLLTEFSLDRPHAVSPDVGTSASLYAAATNPGAFTSLTVGGGGMDESKLTGTLKDIVEAPTLAAFDGVDGADVVAAAIAQLKQSPTSEEELRDYRESYAGDRFVKSAAFVRSYPASLPVLRRILASIQTPVQVVYGSGDPLVPPANAEILARSLPRVRVVALESGHFAWQDAAAGYATAVLSWIGGGYQAV